MYNCSYSLTKFILSFMNWRSTSTRYSCPFNWQNHEIQDSCS